MFYCENVEKYEKLKAQNLFMFHLPYLKLARKSTVIKTYKNAYSTFKNLEAIKGLFT